MVVKLRIHIVNICFQKHRPVPLVLIFDCLPEKYPEEVGDNRMFLMPYPVTSFCNGEHLCGSEFCPEGRDNCSSGWCCSLKINASNPDRYSFYYFGCCRGRNRQSSMIAIDEAAPELNLGNEYGFNPKFIEAYCCTGNVDY